MANQIDNDSKIISARVEGYGYPQIVRATGGRIYVTHFNDAGELEIHYSDNETSWTLDETFFAGTAIDPDMPCLVAYSDGDIALAYSYSTGSDYTIKVHIRNHSTGNWTEVKEVTSIPNNYTVKPLLHINRNLSSRLHLMYIQNNGSSIDAKHYSTDNKGSSWASVVSSNLMSGGVGSVYYRNYSLDSDASTGDLYLWCHSSNTGQGYINRFNSTGTYQSQLADSAGTFQGICGLITSGNKKWTAMIVYNDIRVYYNTSTYGTFGTQSLMFDITDALDGHICMGSDGDDNLYLIYAKTDEKAYMRKYTADTATWSSEIALTTGDGLRPSCEQHMLAGESAIHYTYYSD